MKHLRPPSADQIWAALPARNQRMAMDLKNVGLTFFG